MIYDVEEAPGSVHDFTLCKETLLFVMVLAVIIFADSGYQGILDYHAMEFDTDQEEQKKGIVGGGEVV